MPASDDDREMMARFNDTFRKLKTNREQVPLEVLQTKYGKAYQKLTKEMADLADWFAARLRERMPFPMHPKDIAGNRSYRSRSPPSSPRKASRVPSWTSTERP